MSSDYIKKIFLVTSFLLRYPDDNWFKELKEIKEELKESHEEDFMELLSFIEYAENSGELELEELYVNTFDFSRKTPLHLTYYTYKEQKDRGMELLKIKQSYEKAGFHMVDNELPDFLPLILEFSALTLSSEILMEYYNIIKQIFMNLERGGNPYLKVFSALLRSLTNNEIECKLAGGNSI